MGVHHAWGRTYKDAYQRYFAMTGHELRYQNGFDCQGLWVEVEVERELGLSSKRDILKFGVDRFVNECKKRVLRFAARQTEQSIRLGYWMEWDDPNELRKLADALGTDKPVTIKTPRGKTVTGLAHEIVARLGNPEWGGSYFTFSTENNETIWLFLKKCFKRGKIYHGRDVMPWSGRAGCAYSQMEVAEGRKLTVHTSVFVRFPLKGRDNEYLLVWTTTPWTLTSNVAAAVNPELEYVKLRAKKDGAVYYFAKDNLEFQRLEREFKEGFGRPEWTWPKDVPKLKTLAQIFKEQGGYEILGTLKGADMLGWEYEGPFDELPAQQQPGGVPVNPELTDRSGVSCHRVIDGGRDSKGNPNVVAGEGTGIVHIAPGCGDIDHQLGKQHGLVDIAPLDEEGRFIEGFGEFTGREAIDKETAELVCRKLQEKGLLVARERYPHVYPHCWRTGDELVFRLVDEWFIKMDWRDEIMDVARQIRWLPESINGLERELEWLQSMRDWMISKKRYWGLALPIWVDEQTGEFEVIESLEELKQRAVEGWEEFEGNTPHRPWIDRVKIRNPRTGNLMSRIPDVGNPWLDAGIVPFSTLEYRKDRDYWKQHYPADLVTECFPGQFRNWFYALLAMATMMDNSPPFKTLLGHRLVMNEEGKPMHKSDGTAIWFEEAAEQLGVDTMRWMFLSQDPAVDLKFGTRHPDEPVALETPNGVITETAEGLPTCRVTSKPSDEVRRQVLIPLWNSYAFFVNYARLDEFDPRVPQIPLNERQEIDRWILSNLQELIQTARHSFESYNVAEFCRATRRFIDDLSNWYIRRNRRRFWRARNAEDKDKLAAYQTLYEVLTTLVKLLAPCLPFLTERMYQNLVRSWDKSAPESVHLCDYPEPRLEWLDPELNERMATAQQVVRLGHKLREQANVRVRQPLPELRCAVPDERKRKAVEKLTALIADELNVKKVTVCETLDELVQTVFKPNLKTLGPKYGKLLNVIRQELPKLESSVLSPLLNGENVELRLNDQLIILTPDDVLVEKQHAEGWVSESERDELHVALSTQITPELRAEGIARDFVRHVQQSRKDLNLEIQDRIRVFWNTEDEQVREAVERWSEYIQTETLANELIFDVQLQDGKRVTVGRAKAAIKVEKV